MSSPRRTPVSTRMPGVGSGAVWGEVVGVVSGVSGWRSQVRRPMLGDEVAGGVFGVDAGFDRVAGDGEVGLEEGEGFAVGDADLPFDEVLAGDGFGDRVLDLEACVHFHEVEGRRGGRRR